MPTKERYEHLVKSGICPLCGTKHDGKTKYCEQCLSSRRSRREKRYCVDCGTELAVYATNPPKRCKDCQRIHTNLRVQMRRQNQPPEIMAKINEKANQRYKRNAQTTLEWRKNNPEEFINNQLIIRYGITLHDLKSIFIEQDGKCAICKIELPSFIDNIENRRLLHIDHDHDSGIVRGILCFHCNTGLGQFRDNIELLNNAINYLERFK